jgi:hypothetical protein
MQLGEQLNDFGLDSRTIFGGEDPAQLIDNCAHRALSIAYGCRVRSLALAFRAMEAPKRVTNCCAWLSRVRVYTLTQSTM